MTINVPAPAAFDGNALRAEMEAAGVSVEVDGLVLDPHGTLHIDAPDGSRSAVEQVVAAHKPAPPVDHAAEFEAAVKTATSLDALKAAILGSKGPGAEPRRPVR